MKKIATLALQRREQSWVKKMMTNTVPLTRDEWGKEVPSFPASAHHHVVDLF
jgi:hypothetical protein